MWNIDCGVHPVFKVNCGAHFTLQVAAMGSLIYFRVMNRLLLLETVESNGFSPHTF